MARSAAIIIGTTIVLAGCAQQPPTPLAAGPARECFNARNVSGFTAVDDDTVDVRVGSRRYYRLELAGVCPNVNWARGVALVSRGSSWVCQGLDAELIVPNTGLGPQRCLATSVRRLSDAEVEALRRR